MAIADKLQIINTSLNNMKTNLGIEQSSTLQELEEATENTTGNQNFELMENVVMSGIVSTTLPKIFKNIKLENFNYPTNQTVVYYMFAGCENVETVEFKNCNFSSVTTFQYIFNICKKLKTLKIDEATLNTMGNINNVTGLFGQCQALEEIPENFFEYLGNINNYSSFMLENYKIENVNLSNNISNSNSIDMSSAFRSCSKLKTVYLPQVNFSTTNSNISYMFRDCTALENVNSDNFNINTNSIAYMFYNCRSLTNLDLRKLSGNLTNAVYCFYGCRELVKLDIRGFDFSSITSSSNYTSMLYNVPTTCEIIVKDDTNKQWFNTNFPAYTNVKTLAEYEGS